MNCTRVARVYLVCLLLCQVEGDVPMSMSLLGFGMGTMLANFYMCGIMLLLRAALNMLVRKASPIGSMYFRCPMFRLSGPLSCNFYFVLLPLGWT